MAWIIEMDTDYGERAPAPINPIHSRGWIDEKHDALAIHEFRLADGDDIVYYYGRCTSDSSFAPLDDYGMPNDGCTDIEYKNPTTGKWEAL
jgi:hypothetical protein